MTALSNEENREYLFENLRHFPTIVNGRINIVRFLDASSDLICVVERLGKAFAPVKIDMQGNVDKIKKLYIYDENTCLLQQMLDEVNKGTFDAAEGVLWLNRALLFFELAFQKILKLLHESLHSNIPMTKIFEAAYEGSVKKYHNWVTQRLFQITCKLSPTFTDVMKSFGVDEAESFEKKLSNYSITLHLVRCKIDDFFRDHPLPEKKRN